MSKKEDKIRCTVCKRAIPQNIVLRWALCLEKHANPIHHGCGKLAEQCAESKCTSKIDYLVDDPKKKLTDKELSRARATCKRFSTERVHAPARKEEQKRQEEVHHKLEREAIRLGLAEEYQMLGFHEEGVRAIKGKEKEYFDFMSSS